MPAPHDLDPGVMTEDERLEKKRYDSYHAFEVDAPMVSRAQFARFFPASPLRAFELGEDDGR